MQPGKWRVALPLLNRHPKSKEESVCADGGKRILKPEDHIVIGDKIQAHAAA
jgi:hypothetical protein